MTGAPPIGSRAYWRDPASYPDDWVSRSAHAARFIPDGSRVLDIGCGAKMALSKYLGDGCTYLPADLVAWTPDVRLVDIDAGIFPDEPFDVATLLGVIEYLHAPQNVFRHCHDRARSVVLSYCHPNADDVPARRSIGWVNDFSRSDLASLFELGGLKPVQSEIFRQSTFVTQMLYHLSPR